MNKIDIAGLKITPLTNPQLLTIIHDCMMVKKKVWVTTLYSEFLYASLRDSTVTDMLNKADVAVADGIGIFWAAKYLQIPLTAKSYYGKILQALWQIKYSLAAIIFNPSWIKSALPEKISGSDLIWDLSDFAAKNNFSVYLLGGFEDTTELAKLKIISKYPNIQISASNKNPNDPTIIDDIKKAAPDFLFVAYGPIKQEEWICKHKNELPAKLYIGLGGTFDYIAGKQISPPQWVRKSGFEWLYRLFTQPKRIGRIFNATFGLITALLRYKVFESYPMRENVVCVILNSENKILVGKKKPEQFLIDVINNQDTKKRNNYWQLPQGGTDGEPDLEKAARKEIHEELGIKNDLEFIKLSTKHHSYKWNNALRTLFDNRAYRNKGQNQSIAYFKFNGDGNKINLPKQEEFSEYQWVAVHDLLNIIHPERWEMTKIVQEDLNNLA